MAGRIKGITVEIGGDTTGLDKALKGVNSTIKTTQSSLKDVNKLLKLEIGLVLDIWTEKSNDGVKYGGSLSRRISTSFDVIPLNNQFLKCGL